MHLQRFVGLTLLAAVLCATPASAAGDPAAGKVTYDRLCAQCHGVDGDGKGPAEERMLPRPRIFTDNISYKFRSTPSGELPLAEDLFRSITHGLPGTGMPAWSQLSEQERWDLVAWIETTTEEFSDQSYATARVALPELAAAAPAVSDTLVARGAEVYRDNDCEKCHGSSGRGNGPSWGDQVDDWGVPIDPADFTQLSRLRGGRTAEDIFRTISTGVSGTPMPDFAGVISVEDRWALTWFIRSLDEDPAEGEPWAQLVVAERHEDFDPQAEGSWDHVPLAKLQLGPQLVRSPRLFWPSVTRVQVQAAYTADEVFLRVRWNDRDRSEGSDLVGSYVDPFTSVLRDAAHPDRVVVRFAPGEPAPGRPLPSFLTGASNRPADVWQATSEQPELIEAMARGVLAMSDKAKTSATGTMTWADGQWTLLARRPRSSDKPRNDVQFSQTGVYVPIGFSIWDGSRGEAGTRRAVSPWYFLYLAPEPPPLAPVIPVGKAVLGLLFVLAVGRLTQRWSEAHGAAPAHSNPLTGAANVHS